MISRKLEKNTLLEMALFGLYMAPFSKTDSYKILVLPHTLISLTGKVSAYLAY